MNQVSHKEAALEFLRMIGSGNIREAYRRHVSRDFRHHNPYFPGDADSLMAGMEEDATRNPGKALEVQCALQDGDLVAVFFRVRQRPGDPGWAVVHIMRFRDNLITELWDIGQAVQEDTTNQFGMF